MGDPRKTRSKYDTPVHPWQKQRLEQEKSLMQIYGLVNKTEVYKVDSKLKKFKTIAKKLITKKADQAEKERKQLFDKLKSLNLVNSDSLDDVLGLNIEQLMERRLQTILFKKGLARSVKQARQMITHRHVTVNGKKITSPSYLVRAHEEENLAFYEGSSFVDENHPERKLDVKEVKEEASSEESKKPKPKKQEKSRNDNKQERPKTGHKSGDKKK